MKRIMIQADEKLLERARHAAAQRGVSIAQVVRDALEKELGPAAPPPPLTSVGIVRSPPGTPSARESTEAGPLPPLSWRS